MSDKLEIKFANGSVISGITYENGEPLRGVSADKIEFFSNIEAEKEDSSLARDNKEKEDLTN
jgi:hypothetical protein